MIGVVMALDSIANEELNLLVAGSRYPLTGRNCPDQTGHIEIEVQKGQSPGLFVQIFRSGVICRLFFLAWNTDVRNPMAEEKKLPELLSLEK